MQKTGLAPILVLEKDPGKDPKGLITKIGLSILGGLMTYHLPVFTGRVLSSFAFGVPEVLRGRPLDGVSAETREEIAEAVEVVVSWRKSSCAAGPPPKKK